MKTAQWITGVFLALIVGCVPTRYEWSPDGKWMTVISDSGLGLADADGNLLPATIADATSATWFGDSKRLLVVRSVYAATWDELASYLSPEQIKLITEASVYVREAAMAYDWNAPGADKGENFSAYFADQEREAGRDPNRHKELVIPLAMYVRDHRDAALRAKIPAKWWQEAPKLKQPVQHVEVYSVDGQGAKLSEPLMITIADIRELRVAPNGQAALIVTTGEDDHACDIFVAPADGGKLAVKVAGDSAWYPDWSSDGRDIVFVATSAPATGDVAQLGTLSKVRVVGDDGHLLEAVGAKQDLAGLLYSEFSRVRCLKDGRIVFATVGVNLPAMSKDLPQRPQLFSLTPGKNPTVAKLLPTGAFERVGDSAQYFEVSPNGTKASIPDSSGKVSVVDLATGEVREAVDHQPQPEGQQGKLWSIPQWRSDDQLTVVTRGDNGAPAVALWSWSSQSRIILSAKWPAQIMENQSAATQPAVQN